MKVKYKATEKHRRHLREAMARRKEELGYMNSPETCRKLSVANLGKKHSKESRIKMSISASKRKKRIYTEEARRNIGLSKKGEKCYWWWKGGVTSINEKLKHTFESRQWRRQVFERDDYTCQICKKRGGDLQAHHIKRFSQYPELRYNLDNGQTLCKSCHLTTPNWGGRRDIIII